MQTIGLYYPFIRFRSENWLKVALLYWPKIARILPNDYNEQGLYSEPLKDLGFLVDISPDQSASRVSDRWTALISSHVDELQQLYGLLGPDGRPRHYKPPMQTPLPQWAAGTKAAPNDLTWHGTTEVHVNEMSVEARQALTRDGLARFPNWGADGTSNWIAMRAELAWAYKCLLAEDVADRNLLSLTTDQAVAHALTGRWSAERMAAYLTGDSPAGEALMPGDLGESIGLLAISLVTPANLDAWPIEEIIQIRKQYASEFDEFRAAVDQIVEDLQQHISAIEDPAIMHTYIEQEMEQRLTRHLDDLKRRLKNANFQAAGIVANIRFDMPAGVALAAAWVDRPAIAGAAAAAAGVLSVRRAIRRQRQEIMEPSAATYLYHIQRGTPARALDRSMQRVKWMAGFK